MLQLLRYFLQLELLPASSSATSSAGVAAAIAAASASACAAKRFALTSFSAFAFALSSAWL
jgi:hypothetical protein